MACFTMALLGIWQEKDDFSITQVSIAKLPTEAVALCKNLPVNQTCQRCVA